ncbi:MAG: peptidylprolyl isomerase, partial [Eudoraea sp.]
MKYSLQKNKISYLLFFLLGSSFVNAQVIDSIPDTQIEPQEPVLIADVSSARDTVSMSERVKIDGIAAVVGDYVILDSDIDKTMIDLKNQGAPMDDVTHCGLLGKLMEDRLYAHQAVQDSILVSDDEVNGT